MYKNVNAIYFTRVIRESCQELVINCTCIEIELEFGILVFVEVEKLDNPKKNPRSKDENL